jgi:hypothetical protein
MVLIGHSPRHLKTTLKLRIPLFVALGINPDVPCELVLATLEWTVLLT